MVTYLSVVVGDSELLGGGVVAPAERVTGGMETRDVKRCETVKDEYISKERSFVSPQPQR
jgi:hypothetical protein